MSASITVHLNTSSKVRPLILHGLPGLGLDAAGHHLARARLVAECAGEIEDVADLHRLTERQFCRRRIG